MKTFRKQRKGARQDGFTFMMPTYYATYTSFSELTQNGDKYRIRLSRQIQSTLVYRIEVQAQINVQVENF